MVEERGQERKKTNQEERPERRNKDYAVSTMEPGKKKRGKEDLGGSGRVQDYKTTSVPLFDSRTIFLTSSYKATKNRDYTRKLWTENSDLYSLVDDIGQVT